jgi:glycerol kinase
MKYLLSIDQGTTSTRAVVYDEQARACGGAAVELTQYYPASGWVEHDAEEIWQAVPQVVPRALKEAGVDAKQIAGIGLTNQRETVVLWDRQSGKPVARAIVWQDRRTSDFCRQHQGDEEWLRQRTGLVLDPYFSATKVRWLLEQNPKWRADAEAGRLAFGTIDSWLLWKLTGDRVHATDKTNASRTLFLNLNTAGWDDELCRYFGVPRALLPEVRPSAADFGATQGLGFLPDGLPIAGIAGDQQAALFGQRCFVEGESKCTYGTGAFFLLHTGARPVLSRHRLLTTLAASLDARPLYALEGSVFVAGAAVQWLRDGLKMFPQAADVEALAEQGKPDPSLVVVPAFVGLGAPYWVPEARGALFGVTRNTTSADVARAVLEGVALQVADLLEAAHNDMGKPLQSLRVDGGMARNAWFLQCQADLLGMPVVQTPHSEATALGAALLAGLRLGVWPDLEALQRIPEQVRRFEPRMDEKERRLRRDRWQRTVQAVIAFYRVDGGS